MSYTACRSCGSDELQLFLSLGEMPLANALRDPADDTTERRYPLDVCLCRRCTLVQITETVAAEVLFREYSYFSSFSETFLEHARRHAEQLIENRRLGGESLVVEVASNDGYLLQFFLQAGIPVLGVDPAANIARVAEQRGIPTLAEFFGAEVASRILRNRGPADVVLANNVLAHVSDLSSFVEGLGILAGDDGVVVVEFPYVRDLIEKLEFDTVYHEHLCYFSLTAVADLFRRHGLSVIDVERLPVHGGSLRVTARTGDHAVCSVVEELLREEREWGVADPARYERFAADVRRLQEKIGALVRELAGRGRVAGYGAAAKAVILLNSCGLGKEEIEYVVDRNPYKQQKMLPGVGIPIRGVEALEHDPPEHLVLFPWNLSDEIISQQQRYAKRGGRFVILIPDPRIVG
jgi:hypothetical protein